LVFDILNTIAAWIVAISVAVCALAGMAVYGLWSAIEAQRHQTNETPIFKGDDND
jgi:hypothetical protein